MTPREFLFSLERHGVKLGLDNIRTLLDAAKNPHVQYPSVHVAGTNGKGSVVAMVDAIGRAADYTVGRFTSPHLIDVTERFIVNGSPISSDALDEQIDFFRTVAERMDPPPTFFEMTTAIAFRWFAQCRVDLAVIEVGMGGRLDSTNVIEPLASAITNIALEHTQYLGDTVELIAYEKAGIIKPHIPVVVTERDGPALDVILTRAANVQSPVYLIDRDFQFRVTGPAFDQSLEYASPALSLGPARLGLAGSYQGVNAAAAVALAERLMPHLDRIRANEIVTGLGAARWPCRLERVMARPPVIVDATHNPAGARMLARELGRCVTILAVSADKDAAGIVEALAPITSVFILSRYQGPRSLSVDALRTAACSYPHRRTADLSAAIELGLTLANPAEPLLITGSIFAAGEARTILTQRYSAAPLIF